LLERSGKRREKLLQRSNLLQGRVRDRARKAMSKQEDERGKISRLLHDDIAQGLLALHIRLLTFRKSAKADMGSIKKRIAKTQQVVDNAARTVGRLGHEPDIHHET
jgi:signal transduction histidine kinase